MAGDPWARRGVSLHDRYKATGDGCATVQDWEERLAPRLADAGWTIEVNQVEPDRRCFDVGSLEPVQKTIVLIGVPGDFSISGGPPDAPAAVRWPWHRVTGCGRRICTRMEAHPMGDAKSPAEEADELLMPSQVVRRFRVDPKTITRWSRAGKLDPITTPGGHRRFRASDIQRCLDDATGEEQPE